MATIRAFKLSKRKSRGDGSGEGVPRLFLHFSFLVIFFMIVSYNLGGHGYVHADCGDNRQA